MPDIISQEEAKAAGLKFFFTGKPCKRGHVAERYVSSKNCVECKREYNTSPAHKERTRQWRANNPEYDRQYYKANRDGRLECSRQYYKANRDGRLEYTRQRSAKPEMKEARNARRRERIANDPEYREAVQLRSMLNRVLDGTAGKGTLRHLPPSRLEDIRAKLEHDLGFMRVNPPTWAEGFTIPADYDALLADEEWQIDHIVPVSDILDCLPEESRAVLAYVGSHPRLLRPLTEEENARRRHARDGHYFEELWGDGVLVPDGSRVAIGDLDEIVAEARTFIEAQGCPRCWPSPLQAD